MGQDLLGPFDVDESVHGVQGLRGGDERAVLGATDDRLERVQQRVGVGRTPLVHERVGEQDSTGDRGCVVERHAGELLGQRVGTASVSGLGGLDRERADTAAPAVWRASATRSASSLRRMPHCSMRSAITSARSRRRVALMAAWIASPKRGERAVPPTGPGRRRACPGAPPLRSRRS